MLNINRKKTTSDCIYSKLLRCYITRIRNILLRVFVCRRQFLLKLKKNLYASMKMGSNCTYQTQYPFGCNLLSPTSALWSLNRLVHSTCDVVWKWMCLCVHRRKSLVIQFSWKFMVRVANTFTMVRHVCNCFSFR